MKKSFFESLRSINDFRKVPDNQLTWWIENSDHLELQPGDILFESGSPNDKTFVVIKGYLESLLSRGNTKTKLQYHGQGDVLGYHIFSDQETCSFTCQANKQAEVLCFPKSNLPELIAKNPELTEALAKITLAKARNFSSLDIQNEKLLTLGKLTAGLSHELNHPIVSIQRDNAELNRLFMKEDLTKLVSACAGLNSQETEELQRSLTVWKNSKRIIGTHPKEIAKTEQMWMQRLSSWGMTDPSDTAEAFTDFGLDPEEINYWINKIKPELAERWLSWLGFILHTQALVTNLSNATERIGNLIRTVKTFSYLDWESSRRELDVSAGITATLAILEHKIKSAGAEVSFSKPNSPALVFGAAGELNQVWTNLIDNALDAMAGVSSPKLDIVILIEKAEVIVQITDNGSGIPDEIKAKIFEPFFTTKGVGKGTGMGLDLIKHIVKKHGGKISVNSQPGQTTFQVELPTD